VIPLAIRPADIRRKEFKGGFRGYDANQVDDFLDSIADEFERLFSENRRLTEEVVSLRERLGQFEELEDSIRTALVHAEQVSQDLRQNANKEAELIIREAKERAHRILADSSGRVERVQESYEVLRKAKQDFANDFRRLLKGYLDVMDNVDVASAKEIEASLRERLDLESVAAAREAAQNRGRTYDDTVAGTEVEDSETTRHIDTVATPAGDTTSGLGPEPEIQEPEVEPSSAQNSPGQERAAREAAAAPEPADAAEEVDREEPLPTRESRVADDFFGQGEPRQDTEEERKHFRASRFLRRRDD
jgi:cell division initiation protein